MSNDMLATIGMKEYLTLRSELAALRADRDALMGALRRLLSIVDLGPTLDEPGSATEQARAALAKHGGAS